MILIFLSWLVLFCCFLTFGIAAERLLKLTSTNISITVLLGMAAQTIALTSFAFFTSIGMGLFIGNLLLTAVLAFIFRLELTASLKLFATELKSVSTPSKAVLIIILISALFKCAQSPFILDNERYYIQTIKWLNEYGFVKGLGNLDIAYAQTSGWHILQSGFNFSFLTDRINDLNGFLLVVCSFYFISKFDSCLKEQKQFHWIGFIVVFNVLSYQFLNAPSPDLPLFLIVQMLFYLFLKDNKTTADIKIMSVLFVFLVFIKITIAPLGLLFVFLFWKDRKGIGFFILTACIFGILWLAKNSILSGFPLYPFADFTMNMDWTVPKKLLDNLNYIIKNHEFLAIPNSNSLSVLEKFQIWIRFGGINGIFNKGIVLLFLLVPFTKKIRTVSAYKMLYFTLLLHFIFVFLMSPQFRFFLAEFLFLAALLFSDIANRLKLNPKLIQWGLVAAALLPIFAIYAINLEWLTQNKFNQNPEELRWKQIYLPEKNSKFSAIPFVKIKKGNLDYYSPAVDFYVYGTADGPLPCINKNQLDYFENNLYIFPQLRGSTVKDGFYSKETLLK